jgi:hypothetical protein
MTMIIAGIMIGVLSTVAAEAALLFCVGIYEERRSNRVPTKEEWKVM